MVRGHRADVPTPFPLDHEMRFQKVPEDEGIPVPKVYGWLDDPLAYAMEAVQGRPDFAGVATADRDTIVDAYLRPWREMAGSEPSGFGAPGIQHHTSPRAAASRMNTTGLVTAAVWP